jgi:magnesium chelatase family protein
MRVQDIVFGWIMVSHVNSVAFHGIQVLDVSVQVDMAAGSPSFTIVGLADKTIAESRERVRIALASVGLAMPAKKIVVNLAPADLVKEGSHFDLPIACGILTSLGVLPQEEISEYFILGELSLDGSVNSISGVLPAAMAANARNKGIVCPAQNGKEAAWSGNSKILAPHNILALINHFRGEQILQIPSPDINIEEQIHPDLSDIVGQEQVRRVLEIAASGSHNLIMSGPPGAGKSMLANRLAGILPPMSPEEILESSTVASIAGLISDGKLVSTRPFRAPHHSCSMPAMVGGGVGKRIKPGEVSLAHNGILFLDEIPEFPSSVLESLRQPIENREVLISRVDSHVSFPANFQLIAAMNPCKCGYLGSGDRECSKAPICGSDYQNKISGPIMDRFDLYVDVPAVDVLSITSNTTKKGESSKDVSARVRATREFQLKRYEGYGIRNNAQLNGQSLSDFATPVDEAQKLLNNAVTKFKISMRGYNKLLKVARTIADMERSEKIYKIHMAEAISYRMMDYRLMKMPV